MAEELVNAGLHRQANRFLDGLAAFGFAPEGAFWSIRAGEPDTLELSLLISILADVGPLDIFQVLFQAHDRGLLRGSLDPWQIALYGPGQIFYEAVGGLDAAAVGSSILVRMDEFGASSIDIDGATDSIGLEEAENRLIMKSWIYRLSGLPKQSRPAQLEAWRQFAASSASIAA